MSNLIYKLAKARIGEGYKPNVHKALVLKDRQAYTVLRNPVESITLGQIKRLAKLLKVEVADIIYLCEQQSKNFKNEQMKKHVEDDNA